MLDLSSERLFGYVAAINGLQITATAPFATKPESSFLGLTNPRGTVGEYVVVESRGSVSLAQLMAIELPMREMVRTEWRGDSVKSDRPIATLQLIATVQSDGTVIPGVEKMPRLGDRLFTSPSNFMSTHVDEIEAVRLGVTSTDQSAAVLVRPKSLFGRHLGIVGATGGGKSWSLARIAEEVHRLSGRMLLLDATGEYETLGGIARHVKASSADHKLPIFEFSDTDRILFFRPSSGSQLPKMREAIASLRLAFALGDGHALVTDGCIIKTGISRQAFYAEQRANAAIVNHPNSPFRIELLARQISLECVFPTRQGSEDLFGNYNMQEIAYVASLITRIEEIVHKDDLVGFISPPSGSTSLLSVIDDWIEAGSPSILRIDISELPMSNSLPEIVVNTIGNRLLSWARGRRFEASPLLVGLDEAHRFLGQSLGEGQLEFRPDAFEVLAKEARKFGLSLLLATQRPADVPAGVLSQMGSLLVHRLTERRDQDHVADASAILSRGIARLLPGLVPGEAMLVGADLPIPISVRVEAPTREPNSHGSDFATWKALV